MAQKLAEEITQMRILYVISELTYGGAQKQLVEQSLELDRRGHEVAIYTLNRDVPRERELAGTKVQLVVDQKLARMDLSVLTRLRKFILRWRPDVIHGFLFDGNVYSRVAAIGLGIPVLNSERGAAYTLNGAQRVAQGLTARLACGVIANSAAGSALAQKMFGFPDERMHVVWNGLRLADIEKQSQSDVDLRAQFFGEGDFRVACLVGAIKPEKDYELALQTAQILIDKDPRWRVLFVGDKLAPVDAYARGAGSDTSSYKERILAQYSRIGDFDRIRFAGLSRVVPAIMRQCDVLFVTSVSEGFPNVVLEAMGVGTPVVSTDYSDIRKILENPRQVVQDRSPQAIADTIQWAYDQRNDISAKQRKWVETKATISCCIDQLEKIYASYVARRIRLSKSNRVSMARSRFPHADF
jgi:glycosyltransferase involved in cell wall biosynthesis